MEFTCLPGQRRGPAGQIVSLRGKHRLHGLRKGLRQCGRCRAAVGVGQHHRLHGQPPPQSAAGQALAVLAAVIHRARGQQRYAQPMGHQAAHRLQRGGLAHDARHNTGTAKQRQKILPAVRQVDQHQGLARQVAQAQAAGRRQRVAPGQQCVGHQVHHRLKPHATARQPQVVQQGDVERAPRQHAHQGFGVVLVELHLNGRVRGPHLRQDGGQPARRQGAQAPHPQQTGEFARTRSGQGARLLQQGLGGAVAGNTGRRELHAPRMQAHKQQLAPKRFQVGNGLGHRRLGHAQRQRRPRCAPMVGGRSKVFELAQINLHHFY